MVNVKIHTGPNGFKSLSIYEYLAAYAAQAEFEVATLQAKVKALEAENITLKNQYKDYKCDIQEQFEIKKGDE